MTTDESAEEPNRLQILLTEYQVARDDDRSLLATQAGVASIFAAVIAGLLAVVVNDCKIVKQFSATNKEAQCYKIPQFVLVMFPAIPLAVMGFVALLGIQLIIKSFYMRSIELELRSYTKKPLSGLDSLPPVSGTEVLLSVTSVRRGSRIYRSLLVFVNLAFILAIAALLGIILTEVSIGWAIGMIVVYGSLLLITVYQAVAINLFPRRFMGGIVRYLSLNGMETRFLEVSGSLAPEPKRRGLAAYCILPRPLETVKWLLTAIAFILGQVISADNTGNFGQRVLLALWLIFVFEYLAYQGRYQLNDIRGMASDMAHPASTERMRLPIGRRGVAYSVRFSLRVSIVRFTFALFLSFIVDLHGSFHGLLTGTIATYALAFLYDEIRHPREIKKRFQDKNRAVLIWFIVGAGYAIRIGTGMTVGGADPSTIGWFLFLLFLVASWAFGIAFVTLTWVLEAVGHCYFSDKGELTYRASDEFDLVAKVHLLELIKYTGRIATPEQSLSKVNGDQAKILKGKIQLLTPWNIALAIAIFTGEVASLLQGFVARSSIVNLILFTAFLVSLSISVFMMNSYNNKLRWLLAILGVGSIGVPAFIYDLTAGIVVSISSASFFLVYAFFRQSCYSDLRDGLKKAKEFGAKISKFLLKVRGSMFAFIVGEKTLSLLRSDSSQARNSL